jgi:hypothetical protein
MMPSIPEQMEIFNIPTDLKHDHSDETLQRMIAGLVKLDLFLTGGHEKCVNQLVVYCEMNIKFLFLQSLVNKDNERYEKVDQALQIFVANLMEIFLRKKHE